MTRKLRSKPAKPRPSAKLTELPSAAAHRETAQYEEDNIGVEAANRVTEAAEDGVRYASKLSARPRRELKTEPHGVKQQQKRGIKDAYAKARRGKSTTSATASPCKKGCGERAQDGAFHSAAQEGHRHSRCPFARCSVLLECAHVLLCARRGRSKRRRPDDLSKC